MFRHQTFCFLLVAATVLGAAITSSAQPLDVTDFSVASTTPHSITLSWASYDSADFRRYEVRRSMIAGVTTTDHLASSITSSETTTTTDPGLVAYSMYYYRIFVVDTNDVYSPGIEVPARTSTLEFPHSEMVDDTVNTDLAITGTWAIVENSPGDGDAHTGSHHWSDSPDGNYAPSASSIMMFTIDLGIATMPVLRFWERYAFETNADFAFVEISRDGSTWEQVSFVTGSQTVWKERRIDLTQWTGYGEIRVRFRMAANASTESDGWHIDDITVIETPKPALSFPFLETYEDTVRNWIASSWEVVAGGHESDNRITDSEKGNYTVDCRNMLVSAGVFDLSMTSSPVLTFWHKYSMYVNEWYANEHDYVRVYVSADYGRPGSWVQVGSWTASQGTWTRVQVDLTAYRSTAVRVMFKIVDQPDYYNNPPRNNRVAGGWEIDDIRVDELPQKVLLSNITSSSMHHATLDWVQNTDGNFDRYEIYRATSTSVTRSSALIKVITDQSITSWIDTVATVQPTHYSYRLYAINTLETAGLGSDIKTAEYSVPVTTFPFNDNMGAETTNWAYGYAWGPTTARYHSPPSSWTDSPGTSYDANTSSALSSFVSLSGSAEPVLTFWQRYDLQTNVDFGYVQISEDGGNTWISVLRVTGTDTTWQRERISLDNWKGQTVGLRFWITTNGSDAQDGWYVDDVVIENSQRVVSYPFTDDVEADTTVWFADSPWGKESTNSHSGTQHWSDSPSGDYAANTSSALTVTVDLSIVTMPTLTYWERFSFEANVDRGYVEISTNGTSWSQRAFVTGVQFDWAERRIDLSDVAGTSEIRIRFRSSTSSGTNSDGWHIDDISVAETPTPTLSFPFVESFDSLNATNWITSGWGVVSGGQSGEYRITDSPLGNYPVDSHNRLVTAGVFDLTEAKHPILTFWHHYAMYTNEWYANEHDYVRVYASHGYGHSGTWVQLRAETASLGSWTRVQLDMKAFAGPGKSAVRIAFLLDDEWDYYHNPPRNNRVADGWHLDEIRLEEMPEDANLHTIASSSLHHVSLVWDQNQDDDFDRYDIYRSTSPDVSRSSTLIQTITDQATTTWTDTVSLIQPTQYSYRVYVYDVRGSVSLGSNTITATYEVPTNTFPFNDPMPVNNGRWAWSSPWGPVTDVYHSAPSAWRSNPVEPYLPSANSALTTFVNLDSSSAPVLTFWHRYAFQAGADYGRVEVSTNGGTNWTQLLRVTGVDDQWNQERVDLGVYAGQTIGLRFRVTSDASIQMDGWYLDDIVISNEQRAVEYPWSDEMESGVGAWFPSSPWSLSNVGSHSGEWHWTDSPAGDYAPNENSALTITIDLDRVVSPVLRFWQRYSFEPNADRGYVEVSSNGGSSWLQVYHVTGSSASWRRDEIDLSSYAGLPGVKVRFRLTSNGGTESDGWHIDDVEFVDVVHEFAYPFSDDFDDTTAVSKWITSSWERTLSGRSGPYQYTDSPIGNYPVDGHPSLTMAGYIDLRGTSNPILTFWHHYYLYTNEWYANEHDYIRVYVSSDNGQIWNQVYAQTGSNGTWSKVTINLSSYIGASQVRVRFLLDDEWDYYHNPPRNNRVANGWFLDDVRIGEDITVGTLPDSARFEGPALVHSAPSLASPRLFGRIYEPGLTTVAGHGPGVMGQFGVGSPGSMPNDTTWSWFTAAYLNDLSGADRFAGSVVVKDAGTYALAFRASIDNGATWIYADLDGHNLAGGGVNEFEVDKAGVLIAGFGAGLVLDSSPISIEIRAGEQDSWGFAIGNTGPDPLTWSLFEALADCTAGDVPWLIPQVTQGGVEVGRTATPGFLLDAADLVADSTYVARLLLTSNDAVRDSVWVPVHMSVLPTGIAGFTGYVRAYGGVEVAGGTIEVFQLDGTPVDTLSIAAGGRFVRYGVPAGTFRLSVNVPGAYQQEIPRVNVPIEGLVIRVSPHHVPVASPFFMDLFSEASTLDGDDLPLGSVVTVRDPDGTLCGVTVVKTAGVYGLLHVYADDAITSEDEGARIGDTLRVFVNDVPVPQYATYTGHNVVRRLNLVAGTPLRVPVRAGLSLVSFPVAPRDSTLGDVLASIGGKYSYIAGFDVEWGGARVYVDSLKPFSDLHTVDGTHGYWIRMDEAGEAVIRGGRIHDDAPMQLDRGWNLVGFLPSGGAMPEDALKSILPVLTTVGGFDGGARTFVPGEPFSDLRMMEFGRGYWMHVTMPAVLTYRGAEPMPLGKIAAEVTTDGPVPTREWMDIYGSLTIDGKAAPESTVVTVRDAGGVVCGQTLVREKGLYGFVHAYGDDPTTERDEGPLAGEALQFSVNGVPVIGTPYIVWGPGPRIIRLDLAVNMSPTGVASAKPWKFTLDVPRPNPFNPITVIGYELASREEMSLVVYNQLGQRVRTLAAGVAAPGRYNATWNGKDDLGRDVASGAYLIRLRSGSQSLVNRMVLVR
jgi:hypothetical protein